MSWTKKTVDIGSGVILDGDIVDHATNALVFLV